MRHCLLVSTLLLALPASLAAHGGQYTGPSSGDSSTSGSGPGAAPTGGTGGGVLGGDKGGSMPGAGGASAAAPAARGGSGRGGTAATAPASDSSPAHESWEFWWEANRDRYLLLKHRLYRNVQPSGSAARLTARGAVRLGDAERPSRELVEARILPTLLDVAARADQRDILDSTVLALSRSVAPDHADKVQATAVTLLAHPELTVQGAAVLALGVIGTPDAGALLVHLLEDDSTGRQATGGGAVPPLVRSFAALSLGLLGDPRSAHALLSTVHSLPASERDILSCVIAGLGLLPRGAPAAGVAESCLLELLADAGLDPLVRSYVPTSLGKIGTTSSVPDLLDLFCSERTNILVRQSVAIALGQLGELADESLFEALRTDIASGNDQQTRHFALIALGQIAGRDSAADPARHELVRRLLAREIRGRGTSAAHRSWAGLASALYMLGNDEAAGVLLPELRAAFDDEHDPSFRGAFAIALGLLDDGESAPAIHAAFEASQQQDFRGYAGVALGLLRHRPASDELLELCRDKTAPPSFRIETATSLGLMGDRAAVPVLIESLLAARTLGGLAGSARALGLIGDRSALDPLLALATDEDERDATRAFACVALGLIGERDDLPFNAAIKANNNYRAQTPAIAEVLAIL